MSNLSIPQMAANFGECSGHTAQLLSGRGLGAVQRLDGQTLLMSCRP